MIKNCVITYCVEKKVVFIKLGPILDMLKYCHVCSPLHYFTKYGNI